MNQKKPTKTDTQQTEPGTAMDGEQVRSRPSQPTRSFTGTGFYWPIAVGGLFALAVVILIFQNTDAVTLRWLVFTIEAPLVVIVLVTMLSTGLLTETIGWSWRRARRRVLSDREKLKSLAQR